MPPLPSHFRNFGITRVTVIHNAGTEDEERFETEAHLQAKTAFFAVDTPIYEGVVVEFPDPRGGLARKVAASVDVNNPHWIIVPRHGAHPRDLGSSATGPRSARAAALRREPPRGGHSLVERLVR